MPRAPRFLDVSVPLAPGVPTYPGNPDFEFAPVKRIANGDCSNESRLVMGTHTGTHVDAPLHFFDDGAGRRRAAARPADRPRAGHRPAAPRRHHGERTWPPPGCARICACCCSTPNSALWNTTDGFHTDYTYLTEGGAKFLVEQGVKVVGVDYLSVEQFKKAGRARRTTRCSATA